MFLEFCVKDVASRKEKFNLLTIFDIESIERTNRTSLCIDSFNSINISGATLKDSISINFTRVS